MEIYYRSSTGQILNLMKWPYKIKESELLGYEWSYAATENTGIKNGGTISGIRKKITKNTLTLSIFAMDKELYSQAVNRFLAVTEEDILKGEPGKLYAGDYYYSCYVYGSEKSEWGKMTTFLENKIKIVSPYPFWCREKTSHFLQKDKKPAVSSDTDEYLYYAYSYPYRYSMPADVGHLQNDHYAACDFKMIIYGPCENPSIRINGHLYEVTVVLYPGEYLVIDSRDNTVIRYLVDGRTDNRFNFRNKESNLFQKIPAGRCAVLWNTAAYGFDVTLFQERSEPQWIL